MERKKRKVSMRSKEDNLLIRYKITRLMMEGYAWDQAAAIAMRMFKEGELKGSTPYSKPEKRRERETRRRDRYRR